MRNSGTQPRTVVLTWVLCAVLLARAAVVGQTTASQMSDQFLSLALAFAGAAVLASLADTLMPEAFEHGRPLNAFGDRGRVLPVVRAGLLSSQGSTMRSRSHPRTVDVGAGTAVS